MSANLLLLSLSPPALSPQVSTTSYTSLLHQSSDGMSFSSSCFVFHFSSFSFCPSPAYHFHPHCDGLIFMVALSPVHASITLTPFSFSSLLLPLIFFPLPCTSWAMSCVQHILTRYHLVFQCFVKWKKKTKNSYPFSPSVVCFLNFPAIQKATCLEPGLFLG